MPASIRGHRDRGAVLVIALIVLSVAAVVALAGGRGTVFGLRIAEAGVARLQLRAAAENALERALRSVPAADGVASASFESGPVRGTVEILRDRQLPVGMAPLDGFSVGLGGPGFAAEHYTARATVTGARQRMATFDQQFYVLVPEGT